jgi:hypothetical protein
VGAGLALSMLITAGASADRIAVGPTVLLKDLLAMGQNNPQLLVTDPADVNDVKIFDSFFYAPGGDMPDAADVNVTPIKDNFTGDLGIRFQGAFKDIVGGADSDAGLEFRVTSTAAPIKDADLFINAALTPVGTDGIASVKEVLLSNNVVVATMEASISSPPLIEDPTKHVDFAPVQSLVVNKDIYARVDDSPSGAGTAVISIIDQTFSQVPEPTSIALLLCGVVGLGLFGALRRKQN